MRGKEKNYRKLLFFIQKKMRNFFLFYVKKKVSNNMSLAGYNYRTYIC